MELLAFILYFAVILAIGLYFFFRSKQGTYQYFLGGRQMNSWVVAISAQASDMSGWLLMGLPGSIYLAGMGQVWIAIGLALGTYLNWLFTAKRLRQFTKAAGNAITIPEYLQNRFQTASPALRVVCAAVFLVCFTVYAASAFKAGGILFNTVLGIPYTTALLIGSLIIVAYTFLGGFMAVCWTDLFQGLMMLAAILFVPIAAAVVLGGLSTLSFTAIDPHFLSFIPGGTLNYAAVATIISGLSWGLGYFGMPHILVRFMSIKSSTMIKRSRRIATTWVLLALGAAAAMGLVGRLFAPGLENSETIFIVMTRQLCVPFIAGILLSALLAAAMSTADSQLLVAASSFTSDIYQAVLKKDATEKQLSLISRLTVVVIAICAFILAALPGSGSIMSLVENAWAGFGAAFGPVILLSLYWKRLTYHGAIAGIISGGLTVVLWIIFLSKPTGIYEILPGFLVCLVVTWLVSLMGPKPGQQVEELFDTALHNTID